MGEWWTSMTMGSGLETHPAQTKSTSQGEGNPDQNFYCISMAMGSESGNPCTKKSSWSLD
jgi:hypothetical protein